MTIIFPCVGGLATLTEIEARATELWASLAFDETAKAALKRDGLALDAMRLTGPCPFRFTLADADEHALLSVPDRSDADDLLDLWRIYFQRRLVPMTGREAA
ncbi:hypothetical protein [Flavisphingomonas formosensis]|uniref:hypothetical protein n=1 Tax=Flavisphingomonas formosensis TaxID=861534 RepID=UPI0012FBB81F|nr:hypothetical protein [Sphingomonas formosensis]